MSSQNAPRKGPAAAKRAAPADAGGGADASDSSPASASVQVASSSNRPVPTGLSPTPPISGGLASRLPRLCPQCSGRYPADFKVCPRDATPLTDAPEDDDPLV